MYLFIKGLVDFYLADPLNKFWLLAAFWLVWPGLMFLVGFVGESRVVPIWSRQSKAFFPGDLSLGVMLLALISLHAESLGSPDWWGYSIYWWLAIAVAIGVVACFVRVGDIANYPARAGISPTKITHDFMGYFLIPTLLVGLGIPKLITSFAQGSFGFSWVVFILAILFYVACVGWDIKAQFTPEDILARHPENWQPIWRR